MEVLLVFFILGLCVGSFLNVVILRTYTHKPMLLGRSSCTNCQKTIRAFDLIPVMSFLLLKGRCRFCKTRFSFQYPLVELVTGLLFVFIAWNFGGWSHLLFVLFYCGIGVFLVLVFAYDYLYMMIPDRFVIPGIVYALLGNGFLRTVSVSSTICGIVLIGGFFLVQYLFSRGEWVGGGDIRMGVFMGALLGLSHGVLALFLSYVIGAFVSVLLLVCKRVQKTTAIPFGTFLTIGTFLSLVMGTELIAWYRHFF